MEMAQAVLVRFEICSCSPGSAHYATVIGFRQIPFCLHMPLATSEAASVGDLVSSSRGA